MDNKGQLIIAQPPPEPIPIVKALVLYGLLPIIAPVFIGYKYITDKSFRSATASIFSLIRSASATKQWYFQDVMLLKKLWKLPSAQAYIDESTKQPHLEYQLREGYCCSATQMCILKSFGISSGVLPPQKSGESKPEKFADHISQIASEHEVELSAIIVRGDVSYEVFLSTLRRGLANENIRIACNYLRSVLTGFKRHYHPIFFLGSMFGGHFSPILGIIENVNHDEEGKEVDEKDDNPLVGIFDTNHKYNGAYLVPARQLYAAVQAVDVSVNKNRALKRRFL